MNLQEYEAIKFDLAGILRSIRGHLQPGNREATEVIRDLFSRIAEDRFNLVMVGRFSRGKTSLMNAMLKERWLPTGIVPVTSVITTVTYGSEVAATLYYKNSGLFLDISLKELSQHITEGGNPGNVRGVRKAEVRLPTDFLRHGFFFIDTPGLGSSIIENTRTTESFLGEADAFILVTSYDAPLSEEERRLLQSASFSHRKIFVVLNKQDIVRPDERAAVLAHLHAQIESVFGENPPEVFSASAEQALHARREHDQAELEESGIPQLEHAIIDFVVRRKQQNFLLNLCSRIKDLLARGIGDKALAERVEALRQNVARNDPPQPSSGAGRGDAVPSLLAGCELCARISDEVFAFLAQYQASLRRSPELRQALALKGGLCAAHTSQFEGLAAPLEACIGFSGVLNHYAQTFRSAVDRHLPAALICEEMARAAPTKTTCPACAVAEEARHAAIRAASEAILASQGRRLETLSAICLPHLPGLLEALPPDYCEVLMLRQAEVLERVSDDMQRFSLKQDAAKAYLASQEELTASRRSFRILQCDPNAEVGR